MKNLKIKRTRLIPDLSDKKNKRLFRALNFALIIGGLSLILTFLYLILNLDRADELLLFCLPGLVLGLVLMILYAIGHQKLIKVKKQKRFEKSISFG